MINPRKAALEGCASKKKIQICQFCRNLHVRRNENNQHIFLFDIHPLNGYFSRGFPFSELHNPQGLRVLFHTMRITCAYVDDRVAHPTERRRGDNYGLHSRLLYSCVQFATCALSVSQITPLVPAPANHSVPSATANPPRDHSFTSAKVLVQFDSIAIGFRSMMVSANTRIRVFKRADKDTKRGKIPERRLLEK